MNTVIIIPSRYQSTRFPGKPLHKIKGKMLVQRVWEIAVKALDKENVYIATDDSRIEDAVLSFGGKVIMTSPDCANGSERVMDAIKRLEKTPDIVVNFQGDSVISPPWILSEVIDAIKNDKSIDCATPVSRLLAEDYDDFLEAKRQGDYNGVMAVFDKDHNALFFSRSMLPLYRDKNDPKRHSFKHIGIYAYRTESLKKYLSLEMGILEDAEQLEQLRMLENGMKIKCVEVDFKGRTPCSIDTPSDAELAEKIIEKEGEL